MCWFEFTRTAYTMEQSTTLIKKWSHGSKKISLLKYVMNFTLEQFLQFYTLTHSVTYLVIGALVLMCSFISKLKLCKSVPVSTALSIRHYLSQNKILRDLLN